MKTKLLRKLRTRIISVDFYNKIYADIKYYDKHDDVESYRIFGKRDLLYLIRSMFGAYLANHVEDKNYKTNLKRRKEKLSSPVYKWHNE